MHIFHSYIFDEMSVQVFLFIYLFACLFTRQRSRYREGKRARAQEPETWERELSPLLVHSPLGLGPAKTRSQELNQSLPGRGKGPNHLSQYLLPPRAHIVGRWNLDLNFGTLIKDVSVPSDILTTQPITMF